MPQRRTVDWKCKYSISLLVNYTCTGNAQCPRGNSAEQFDFGCTPQKKWSVGQYSNFEAARHKNPIANFDTALRKGCTACFMQHPLKSNSESILPFDQVTHCVSKFMIHIIYSCFINFRQLLVIRLCRVSFAQTVPLTASVPQAKRL